MGISAIKIEEDKDSPFCLKRLVKDGYVVGSNQRRLQEIINIFTTKSQEKRNERDAALLQPLLTEIHYFKERRPLPADDIGQIGCMMSYARYPAGHTIFRKGDQGKGEKFYLILKGKVQVQIEDPLL